MNIIRPGTSHFVVVFKSPSLMVGCARQREGTNCDRMGRGNTCVACWSWVARAVPTLVVICPCNLLLYLFLPLLRFFSCPCFVTHSLRLVIIQRNIPLHGSYAFCVVLYGEKKQFMFASFFFSQFFFFFYGNTQRAAADAARCAAVPVSRRRQLAPAKYGGCLLLPRFYRRQEEERSTYVTDGGESQHLPSLSSTGNYITSSFHMIKPVLFSSFILQTTSL